MISRDTESVKLVRRGAWVGIIGNFLIAVIKLIIGFLINSIAVIADAIHSFEDLLSSVVLLIGYGWVSKPPDREHPYGHGRAQEITGFINSFIILIAAFQIGLYSVKKIIHPVPVNISFPLLFIILATAFLKEGMARYAGFLAEKSRSLALKADAWHHRTDALSSLIVIAALLGMKFGIFVLDGILGVLLALFIAWLAISWLKKVSSALLGEAPSEELVKTIEKIVLEVDGAHYAHRIRVHSYGSHKEITLHLQMNPEMSLFDAHKIATEVEERIKERVGGEVTVHVEPIGDEFEKSP